MAPALVPRCRPLTQSPYHGSAAVTYKHDARSCVWRMGAGASARGDHVAKRFVYSPLRQRLGLWSRLHPGLLELAGNRALRRAGVAVVPIVDTGFERAAPMGLGCRFWLITPTLGESLQQRLRAASDPPSAEDEAQRERWIMAAADLTRQLLEAGFTFRDLKPSNIVFDAADRPHLLDVGSVRATTAPDRVAKMVATMRRVLIRDGVSAAMADRFIEAVGWEHRAAPGEATGASRRN